MARNSYLKFDTAVSDHFGSNNTAIAFARLIYWFGKKPEGFYKFKEACKHPLYKEGDSWSEDLKMTKRILDPILKRLVTHHISKNAYRESKDKFLGKMFCSYTERNTNRTFYFMDRGAVDQFLASLDLTPPLPSPLVKPKPMEVDVVSSRPKNMPLETPRREPDVVPLTCARQTAFNTQTITSLSGSAQTEVGEAQMEKEKLSSKKMIELWNSHAQDKVVWYPSTSSRLYKVLSDFFGGCLETFRNYCAGIASSKFLMGKAPNSKFKAIFYWIIKPEVIKSIFQGAYGVEAILSKIGNESEADKLEKEYKSVSYDIQKTKDKIEFCNKQVIEAQKKSVQEYQQTISQQVNDDIMKAVEDEVSKAYDLSTYTKQQIGWIINTKYKGALRDYSRAKLNLCKPEEVVVPQELFDEQKRLEDRRVAICKRLQEIAKENYKEQQRIEGLVEKAA